MLNGIRMADARGLKDSTQSCCEWLISVGDDLC